MAKGFSLGSTETLILGGVAIYLIYKSNILQNIGTGAGKGIADIGAGIRGIGIGVGNSFTGFGEGLAGFGVGLGSGLSGFGVGLGSGLSGLGNGLGGGLYNLGSGFGAGVQDVGLGVKDLLLGTGNLQTEIGAGIQNFLTQFGSLSVDLDLNKKTFSLGFNNGGKVNGALVGDVTIKDVSPNINTMNVQPSQDVVSQAKANKTAATTPVVTFMDLVNNNKSSSSNYGTSTPSKTFQDVIKTPVTPFTNAMNNASGTYVVAGKTYKNK